MLSSNEIYADIPTGTYPMRSGEYGLNVEIKNTGSRYEIDSPYSDEIRLKIKQLDGRKWHGFDDNPRKIWSCKINARNNFRLRRMMGKNTFELYDLPLVEIDPTRPLLEKQVLMVQHGLTRKRCIIAGEMGTGKTLSAIEIMERSGKTDWWWIGPRSALAAVQVEMRKWKCRIRPNFMTYEGFTKLVNTEGTLTPDGIVFDESSKIKTPTSKRTLAALAVANSILFDDGYLILMSGTPAPKNPTDWWSQTEVCCPGYLVESSANIMKYSLAYITEEESYGGNTFPKLVGWKDTEKRCAVCGEYENSLNHTCTEDADKVKRQIMASTDEKEKLELRIKLKRIENTQAGLLDGNDNVVMHKFEPGPNEVTRLFRRLKGLAVFVFKKDCQDLPEKFYRVEHVKPTPKMLEVSSSIKKSETRAVTALMKLRQISDGFLYTSKKTGERDCATCEGKGKVSFWWSSELGVQVEEGTDGAEYLENEDCPDCGGSGKQDLFTETTLYTGSPKEAKLLDLMDEVGDIGRLVVFAAFTATIDRIIELVKDAGWNYIRVDGRGWDTDLDCEDAVDMLEHFQDKSKEDKIVIVLHPESGGMGLTLTASPMAIFYSNDFKAENRMQAEDRIHRIGMDESRGATIVDIFCLETDEYIHDNLMKKKDLQKLTMGDIPDGEADRSDS